MSDHQPPPSTQQELDLSDIFSIIRRFFRNIVDFFFGIIEFMIRKWWVIVPLIITGVLIGFVTKGDPSYEAKVLLKTNFRSQSYVYTAIKQFHANISEGDVDFITSLGKDPTTFGLTSVEISPVVEVLDLISYIGENDRVLGKMMREFKLEDDRELFATDRFLSSYKYHNLTIGLNSEQAKEDIQALLDFVNDEPFALELKERGLENHNEFVAQSDKTLQQVDELIKRYTSKDPGSDKLTDNGIYFDNRTEGNLAGLLDFKINLARNTKDLKSSNVSYEDVAVIVSNIQAARSTSLLNNVMVIYPILLVFLFLMFSGTYRSYRSYKMRTTK